MSTWTDLSFLFILAALVVAWWVTVPTSLVIEPAEPWHLLHVLLEHTMALFTVMLPMEPVPPRQETCADRRARMQWIDSLVRNWRVDTARPVRPWPSNHSVALCPHVDDADLELPPAWPGFIVYIVNPPCLVYPACNGTIDNESRDYPIWLENETAFQALNYTAWFRIRGD